MAAPGSTSLFITSAQSYCCCAFSPKLSYLSIPFVVSNVPIFSSSLQTHSRHTHHELKLKHLVKATSDESEFIEDSKFVPLDTDDDSTFGPAALLLIGFEAEELPKVEQFLKELEGDFLEVIVCTEDMITGTLWEAINTKQPNLDASKIAKSVPRICFFSGLTGEEMTMFIDDFPASGLESPVFAAVVPNSADKPLQEVIEEIMGDHELMSSRELS